MTDKVIKQVQELLEKLSGKRAANDNTAAVDASPPEAVQPADYARYDSGEADFGPPPTTGENVRIMSGAEARAAFGDDFIEKIFGGVSQGYVGEPFKKEVLDKVFDQLLAEDAASCDIVDVLEEVHDEVHRARNKHPTPFNSPHEGFAILKEEVDELWETIKADGGWTDAARKEAVQVAAMAVRYLVDLQPTDDDDE
jgi:hypothetical protein